MIMVGKKKTVALLGVIALLICIGVVNNKLTTERDLSANAEYVNYEMDQMRAHDGEVLVDSVNYVELPGTAEDVESGAIYDAEVSLVSSDNIEELANNNDAYFSEVRSTIAMDRNEIISMLTDVIEENPTDAEAANATQQKLKIIGYMEKEKIIESMIINKGFTDALVIMTDTTVSVTVNKQELSQADVAKIVDIVTRETQRPASQIVIQNKY